METAVVLVQCPDQKGIVAKISDFVFRNDGNIIQSDQHTTDATNGSFFMRLEFCFDTGVITTLQIETAFGNLARQINAKWEFFYKNRPMRMGILVSKQDHCLFDILYRWKSGELRVEIPFVISNHPEAKTLVQQFGIDYIHIPKDGSHEQHENLILQKVSGTTDFLVLARYMQILSGTFLQKYKNDIINIHHSFLPSFKGANPYRQAYERGVKIIGATAHYVTGDLDEGPIIEQAVERVSHRDRVEDLIMKGRNLEKLALASALRAHVDHRIIRDLNKTVVFF